MTSRVHVGYFEDEHQVLAAVEECRERRIPIADVVSPFPIHGLDSVLGLRPSRLPWVTLAGGLLGAGLGLWFEYWSSWENWPINVGGKPFDSLPAFVPVAFELTILFAGLSTFFVLLGRCGLWPGTQGSPIWKGTTDDRIALILQHDDAAFEDAEFDELLGRHGAVAIERESAEVSA